MTFKKEFWTLLSIFLLPIGLGTLFFYLNPSYFSQNTVNYGELISPVIVTEKSDIELLGDATLDGIWTFAYVTESCDALFQGLCSSWLLNQLRSFCPFSSLDDCTLVQGLQHLVFQMMFVKRARLMR